MNLLDFSNTESVISANSFTDFEQLAELCPFTHGQGVYIARALYTLIDPLYEFVNICETDPNFAPKKKQITDNEHQILIYPNPVNETLYFSVNEEEIDETVTIEISDVNGRIITSKKMLLNDINSIDVSSLSNGCYLFKLIFENKNHKTEKFCVVK